MYSQNAAKIRKIIPALDADLLDQVMLPFVKLDLARDTRTRTGQNPSNDTLDEFLSVSSSRAESANDIGVAHAGAFGDKRAATPPSSPRRCRRRGWARETQRS